MTDSSENRGPVEATPLLGRTPDEGWAEGLLSDLVGYADDDRGWLAHDIALVIEAVKAREARLVRASAPVMAAGDRDSRFAIEVDAAIVKLNAFLIELGPRLSVGQHSQIMKRMEDVILLAIDIERERIVRVDAAMAERKGTLAIHDSDVDNRTEDALTRDGEIEWLQHRVKLADKDAAKYAAECTRLREVILTGGAMYRAERACLGVAGGIDPDERK